MTESDKSVEGGCDCGGVRYRMTGPPLFVHCCHCRWCQRESGASFALNALIEADRIVTTRGAPDANRVPSESGKGQIMWRCPTCRITLWSNYAGAGDKIRFVRVGTLDEPDACPPDVHIFTESKQPWIVLSDDIPVFAGYYDPKKEWPPESLARRRALFSK